MFLGVLVIGMLATALALSRQTSQSGDMLIQVEDRNPWTHLRFNNDPAEFRFAIVSDRTGGHRARVFSQAVEQLNLLQPEFVLSVGDLIEGFTENADRLNTEWKEFQGYVSRLQMPFFYVPGNHDITNLVMQDLWKEKFGRSYYSFSYRGVLFLVLHSDDPPGKGGHISEEQVEFVKKTLAAHSDSRWTMVYLHKPLWTYANLEKNGWLEVEKGLGNRPYTVFAGHIHHYQKFVRNGRDYYQLATTGGDSKMRGVPYGEFDHLVWVTMKKSGPVLANLLLDGILPEDLRKPITEEKGIPETNRKPTYPVQGQVVCDGCAVAGAFVEFFLVNPESKRRVSVGDAVTEGDGSFTLSTYLPNDGAPAGEYQVAVYFRASLTDPRNTPTPLPEKYRNPETSGLTATVKAGKNMFTFELKK
jgi:hypothetical protein